ncbi:flippase [Methanoplanus limicola]|uniref:Polysaccharide biosynthesis protein n=1 Tax=Methanoplanus limicola DSM 2279 TaxID=937775 RepID=H1Z0C2_9EURY|nr:flippase [Methanoplanus limicola]EHQ34389.1 polysaccharide biosynthesis protein [Methanoplanus limicola DSM 2279]
MHHKKFIKDVGIIGITQATTSLAAFLLLPLITKTLGPYDYGIWAQISVTVSLLTPLGIMGLQMAAVRFLSAEKDKQKIQESFYSILLFVFVTGLVISSAVFLLSDNIASFMLQDESASYYVKAGAGLILLGAVGQIVTFYFRIFRQINFFGALTIYKSVGHLVLTTVLLLNGFGLMSVIGANLIVMFTLFLLALFFIYRQIGIVVPKFCYIKDFLKFGAPLTPNGLIRWVTDSSDRYIIGFLLGATMVGIYNAAYAIGSLIQLFITPLQMILYPELARLYDEGDHDTVRLYLSMAVKYFSMIAIPAVFGLFVISEPLILLFTTEEFVEGAGVIPVVALGAFFAGLFQILINIPLLVKKTKLNLYIQLSAAIANLVLNIILIPILGIIGAAYATLLSFLIMLALCHCINVNYYMINYDYIAFLKCIIASGFMLFPLLIFNNNSFASLIEAIIISMIVYFISLALLKFFSIKERKFIISIFKR